MLGAILMYCGAHFGVCFSIFESWSPSYLMKFYTDVFCITLTVNILRKDSQHLSLCWGALCNIFGSLLGILLNVLKNVKNFLDVLHNCLHITAVVTKLINVLILALHWAFLGGVGPVCTIFVKYYGTISHFHLIFCLSFFLDPRPTEGLIISPMSLCLSVFLSVSLAFFWGIGQ